MYTPVTPHPVVPEAQQERSGLARLWYQLGPGSRRRQRLARAEAQRLVALHTAGRRPACTSGWR